MTRTAAILHVLDSHVGEMRPIEVWEELQRRGRQGDPQGDVSTTMYDLWQRGRIGREGRGQYHALAPEQVSKLLGADKGRGSPSASSTRNAPATDWEAYACPVTDVAATPDGRQTTRSLKRLRDAAKRRISRRR